GAACAARVELEAAALGGDGDPQRVPRKEQLGRAAFDCRSPSRAAGFAGAVNLEDALARGEIPRRRHFFEKGLDVRAQELERAVAGLADEMKVARMPVRVLEAEPALAKIDLARDARLFHPLQRAVDGGAADFLIFPLDQVVQIVGSQMSFLVEKDIDDEIALAGRSEERRVGKEGRSRG